MAIPGAAAEPGARVERLCPRNLYKAVAFLAEMV
jgi:hypothetical protein